VPLLSFASDVPGEQPRRHHGVRLRGGPGVAPRALHDRVLPRHVAAWQDGRDLMNCLPARQVSDRELRSVSLNSHSLHFISLPLQRDSDAVQVVLCRKAKSFCGSLPVVVVLN
jgi:hypothetical protein